MSMSPSGGRGWYPDPEDPSRLRHWDGKAWGTETRLQPPEPMPPPSPESAIAEPDIPGRRAGPLTYVAVVLAPLAVAMSIPFAVSFDGLPSTDAATVPGYALWQSAFFVAAVSLVLGVAARRKERERRSRKGRVLSNIAFWTAVVAVCTWFLDYCSVAGSGL